VEAYKINKRVCVGESSLKCRALPFYEQYFPSKPSEESSCGHVGILHMFQVSAGKEIAVPSAQDLSCRVVISLIERFENRVT
jgi:hypothetical protein